jgi:hypothetical protein
MQTRHGRRYLRARSATWLRALPARGLATAAATIHDQPLGEFLHIAMAPTAGYGGKPIDFTVANGGAGLSSVATRIRTSLCPRPCASSVSAEWPQRLETNHPGLFRRPKVLPKPRAVTRPAGHGYNRPMEMTMSGEGRRAHRARRDHGSVGVTYRATEFERVYVMTAARIRGKRPLIRRDIPRDRIVLKSEPLTYRHRRNLQ